RERGPAARPRQGTQGARGARRAAGAPRARRLPRPVGRGGPRGGARSRLLECARRAADLPERGTPDGALRARERHGHQGDAAGADALTLFERFETKLGQVNGNLRRAAVDLAKDWRTDRLLRRLEALLAVADRESSLVVSGTGDVIEPEDGICAIGSGGNFALAAARVLVKHSRLDARQIAEEALRTAAEICVYY